MHALEIADDVFMISVYPRSSINVFLAGGVLIDAGVRGMGARILDAIGGRALNAHALTHAHADHQGASAEICRSTNLPFWCGERDVTVAECGPRAMPDLAQANSTVKLVTALWAGAGHPVQRRLREDDRIGDFSVIETPGHSPGHIAFWRAADRVLITGDVINNMSFATTLEGVKQPPDVFTSDIAADRRAIKRIAALNPRITAVGHGPVLREPAKLATFAARL
jgi:hydroxyacylglutathione hydrolase